MRGLVIFFAVWAASCNEASFEGRSERSSMAAPKSSALSTGDDTATVSADGGSEPKNINESGTVVAPSAITGAYLFCETPNRSLSTVITTYCALRDNSTGKNITLKTNYKSHQWSIAENSGFKSSVRELSETDAFQAEFLIESNEAQIDVLSQRFIFLLSLVDSKDEKIELQTPLNFDFLRWQSVNGGNLPQNAVAGGTELNSASIMYICRILIDGRYYFGKMEMTQKNPFSICYTSKDNKTYQSNAWITGKLLFPSDVLVVEDGHSAEEVISWIASTDALPELMLVGGRDSKNQPVYPCRAPNYSDIYHELTPGRFNPTLNLCMFEYGGVHVAVEYEILQWKSQAAKASFEAKAQ